MGQEKRSSRSRETPYEDGPRVFRRGRYWNADLRPWGGTRTTLRDPKHPTWPSAGDRTEDKEAALRWAWAYVDELRDQRHRKQLGRPKKAKTLAQAKEEYLRHQRHRAAPSTLRSAGTAFSHLEQHLGGTSIRTNDITPEMLQALVDTRLDAGYKPDYIRTMCAYLSGFFKSLDGPNPMGDVCWPPREHRDAHAWTDEELSKLRAAADTIDEQQPHRLARRAVELALATGTRQRELFALEWGDLHPKTSTTRIVRQQDPARLRETKPLKGKENRTALVRHDWWPLHEAMSVGLVLYDKRGRALSDGPQRDLIRDVLRTAGLYRTQIGWHSLRHTYARLFVEDGGKIHDLQKCLGHKSLGTTERYYEHLSDETAAARAREAIYGPDWRPPLKAVE